MSLVSLAEYADLMAEQDDSLDHTCDLSRTTQTGTDDDGQPIYETAPFATDVPCAFIAPSGGGEMVNADISALITQPELIVSYGTNVVETDTVTAVRDQYDVVIGGPYNITRVDKRAMHYALQLEEIA